MDTLVCDAHCACAERSLFLSWTSVQFDSVFLFVFNTYEAELILLWLKSLRKVKVLFWLNPNVALAHSVCLGGGLNLAVGAASPISDLIVLH